MSWTNYLNSLDFYGMLLDYRQISRFWNNFYFYKIWKKKILANTILGYYVDLLQGISRWDFNQRLDFNSWFFQKNFNATYLNFIHSNNLYSFLYIFLFYFF